MVVVVGKAPKEANGENSFLPLFDTFSCSRCHRRIRFSIFFPPAAAAKGRKDSSISAPPPREVGPTLSLSLSLSSSLFSLFFQQLPPPSRCSHSLLLPRSTAVPFPKSDRNLFRLIFPFLLSEPRERISAL